MVLNWRGSSSVHSNNKFTSSVFFQNIEHNDEYCSSITYVFLKRAIISISVSVLSLDQPAFPADLPPWLCSQKQIAEFTRQAKALGVQYFGLCCGNRAHYTRTMAENLGRNPPASRYITLKESYDCRVLGTL